MRCGFYSGEHDGAGEHLEAVTNLPANILWLDTITFTPHDCGSSTLEGILGNTKTCCAMRLRVHINQQCSAATASSQSRQIDCSCGLTTSALLIHDSDDAHLGLSNRRRDGAGAILIGRTRSNA